MLRFCIFDVLDLHFRVVLVVKLIIFELRCIMLDKLGDLRTTEAYQQSQNNFQDIICKNVRELMHSVCLIVCVFDCVSDCVSDGVCLR